MPTAVDLFSGCGGLSKGFEDAGFTLLAAFENWDAAADCYEKNFTHAVHRIDLTDCSKALSIIRPLSPDVIIGGPPCQDFSHAGKRIESQRAELTKSFATIISKVKPKVFVMENVARARNSDAYASARALLSQAGYGLTESVLLASRYGVPQRRRRFFCIGLLGGQDNELQDALSDKMSKGEMTVREYMGHEIDTEFFYRHPRNYQRRGIFSIDEPAPTIRGINRPIPENYEKHPNDKCDPDEARALTTYEIARIQSFPKNYKWVGAKTDLERMIGNAVPVELARFVAEAVLGSGVLCDAADKRDSGAK